LIAQFKLPVDDRNYGKLDMIIEKLKFFKKFSRQTRIYLLRLANLTFYESNQIIFNQGDEGDLMYIIIRGGCHVRIKRETMDGNIENPVVHTMYDGI
jgi:hypothetical protein